MVPAVLVVTNPGDSGPGTLRAAITQADLDTTPDSITFAPSVTGTITLSSALPDLSGKVVIAGPGSSALTVARSGATGTPVFRVFTVTAGAEVTVSGLTLSGGQINDPSSGGGGISNLGALKVTDCTITGNSAGAGGGVFNQGTLTVTHSAVTGNSVGGDFGSGGGLYNQGTLTVTDSTVSNNTARNVGGGFYNKGALTVTDSTAAGNSAFGGAGIYSDGALTVTDSTIAGNSSGGGGGGITNFKMLTLTNTTLRDNSAVILGGGLDASDGATQSVTNCTISGNSAGEFGGGLAIGLRGVLTVTDSTIAGNSTGGYGGAIENSGFLTVSDSTFSSNKATVEGGGGIINLFRLTVTGSTFVGNSAGTNGGGIENDGFPSTVTDSTFVGNSANIGGGIANGGTLTLTGSTLSDNLGHSGGGGLSNLGTLTVVDSTLSGNSAYIGGGIANGGTLTVTDSTLSGNLASAASAGGIDNGGTLTVTMSILANSPTGNLVTSPDGAFVSGGHNLFSDNPGVPLSPSDLVNTDPLLGPLADNGGPTQTMALLPGSPAIDAGVTVAGVTTDQRGVPRPQGAAPDIGAYESRGFTIAVVGGSRQAAPLHSLFPTPLVVTVSSPFGEPVAGGRVTLSAPTTGPSVVFTGNPATIGANGQAVVQVRASGLPGSYAVTARASGAGGVALTLTNVAPAVASLRRTGVHDQPTRLVLTFTLPMNAATVQDLRNYALYPVGPNGYGGPNPRPVPIVAAVYDPVSRTVTLTPETRLPLSGYYLLTVSGVGLNPVRDVYGNPLTGTGTVGLPGDYIARVHGYGPSITPSPVVFARTASAVPAGPRSMARH